mmetsp:Transcript_11172/g.21619  ORF Transcript_11172/g.21619 Transcript_11172/m.21619 type:complete len:123 (-) Transcript_11172:859-1227(-)
MKSGGGRESGRRRERSSLCYSVFLSGGFFRRRRGARDVKGGMGAVSLHVWRKHSFSQAEREREKNATRVVRCSPSYGNTSFCLSPFRLSDCVPPYTPFRMKMRTNREMDKKAGRKAHAERGR